MPTPNSLSASGPKRGGGNKPRPLLSGRCPLCVFFTLRRPFCHSNRNNNQYEAMPVMNFIHKILGTNRAGYAPLASCPAEMACINSPEVPDPSSREYAELKEKTIRIIAAMPAQYLSADKGRAAIKAIQSGSVFLHPLRFFSVF
nr:hypothetical protein [Pandoravirus belohorizontensis]